MPTGSGGTFGAALVDYARQLGYTGRGEMSTYRAKGWHAQLSKLTSSDRGSRAADAVGLDVSPTTLRRWLSETQAPSKANRELIERAYRAMAGTFPRAALQGHRFEITGRVTMGRDSRVRGQDGHAPLRVEGSSGDWSRIEEAWEDGELDDELFEEYFIEDVIYEDIGEGAGYMEFNGGTGYSVS
jgi:hypothetical protein